MSNLLLIKTVTNFQKSWPEWNFSEKTYEDYPDDGKAWDYCFTLGRNIKVWGRKRKQDNYRPQMMAQIFTVYDMTFESGSSNIKVKGPKPSEIAATMEEKLTLEYSEEDLNYYKSMFPKGVKIIVIDGKPNF
jgi:hypothetical protein|tara:strand:- start:4456 stop:4851 length:396 start_codon:yes stop_codon:yes gene_type:complete